MYFSRLGNIVAQMIMGDGMRMRHVGVYRLEYVLYDLWVPLFSPETDTTDRQQEETCGAYQERYRMLYIMILP
jgi:hypothetical protein